MAGSRELSRRRKAPVESTGARDAQELLSSVFREAGLLLGGIVMIYHIEDDLLWRIVRGLDRIRRRHMGRVSTMAAALEGCESPFPRLRPHPAIEAFLRSIRDDEERARSWARRERDREGPARTGRRR